MSGTYHCCDIIEALQIFYNAALVGWLDAGETAGGAAGLSLQVGRQLIKLPSCEAAAKRTTFSLLFLLFSNDAHSTTDRQGSALIVTCNALLYKLLEKGNQIT